MAQDAESTAAAAAGEVRTFGDVAAQHGWRPARLNRLLLINSSTRRRTRVSYHFADRAVRTWRSSTGGMRFAPASRQARSRVRRRLARLVSDDRVGDVCEEGGAAAAWRPGASPLARCWFSRRRRRHGRRRRRRPRLVAHQLERGAPRQLVARVRALEQLRPPRVSGRRCGTAPRRPANGGQVVLARVGEPVPQERRSTVRELFCGRERILLQSFCSQVGAAGL